MKAHTYLFIGLLTSNAGMMAANSIFGPIARQIGLGETQTGLVISVSALMAALMSPIWGARSEVWGRKRVFVFALLGGGLTFLLFSGTVHFGLLGVLSGTALFVALMAVRACFGSILAGAPVAAQAYIGDTTTESERSAGMALLGIAGGLGLILGPALAALLVGFGLLVPLYGGGGMLVVVGLLLAARMPRSVVRRRSETTPKLRSWDRRVAPFILVSFASFIAISIIQITIGFFLMDRFSLAAKDAAQFSGIGFLVVGVALVVAQAVIVRRLRWPPARFIGFGLPVMAAGYVGLLFAPSTLAILPFFAVMGLGSGLTVAGAMAGASVSVGPDEQGAVAGLNGAANAWGTVVGPVLGTSLYQFDMAAPYIAVAIALSALAVFIWLKVPTKDAAQPTS